MYQELFYFFLMWADICLLGVIINVCVRCRGVILFSKVIGSIYDEYFGFVHASSSNQLKKRGDECEWLYQIMPVVVTSYVCVVNMGVIFGSESNCFYVFVPNRDIKIILN